MVNDIIADSLTRLRNAIHRRKTSVDLEYGKIVVTICDILKSEKFITDYKLEGESVNKKIVVSLSYDETEGARVMSKIKRVSKPGLRIYRAYKELKPVLNGYGIAIISTAKGVISDADARKKRTGGEVICEIY